MKQHNHWKLTQIQKALIKVVLWGFGIILLIVTLVFKVTINYDVLSWIISIISIILGIFLALVERVLWKTPIMKLPFLENYWTPNLEGRWEGTLTRGTAEHPFVIEIKQSFTNISCITYSNHSSSTAYATEILYNDQLQNYQLIYYWNCKTANVQENTGDANTFDGFTVLNIIIKSGQAITLNGLYFTDRQPKQTRDKLDLKFSQKELKNAFN